MTAVDQDTDVFQLILEANDLAVPCELPVSLGRHYVGGCGGANPAEWICHLNRCCSQLGPFVLYCTGCKDLVLRQSYCWCPLCSFVFAPASTAFRLIEPLGRPA